MSDDLNKKIKQITDILSQENMPDNIKGLLNMLSSSSEPEEPAQKPAAQSPAREERPQKSEIEDNVEMVRKIKKVMDHVSSSSNDPRVNLLNAIRPFLNTGRQKKVNNCIKLIQMSSISRLLDDSDKGNL